jgi:hypothetical protein
MDGRCSCRRQFDVIIYEIPFINIRIALGVVFVAFCYGVGGVVLVDDGCGGV